MLDLLDRPLRDLRISVTDRCNLRCRYCMPREVYGSDFAFLERSALLSYEEIARIARVLAGLGVRKVRLTGGEPLLRRDVECLVSMLARIDGIEEVAMTTNGLLLARKARALADAGLSRVTVSLDSLDDRVLREIADAPVSARRVLAGIDAAIETGMHPVKVNMMVRRGVNEACVGEMAAYFRERPVVLRFIEYMDVGSSNGWRAEHVVPATEILAKVQARWPLQALPRSAAGDVATRYRYSDGAGEIGVIHSVSEPFCGGCTRARLSADGKLFTCLFASAGHDLRALLRGGAGEIELRDSLRGVWGARSDRYSAERRSRQAGDRSQQTGELDSEPSTDSPAERSDRRIEMSYIGG
jgi:cyclic pyranopterin phosphate synthase